MRKLLSLLLCVPPCVLMAQSATQVAGPVSGVVFDRASAALRPMVGVPGASYLGNALLTGVEAAAVSPDGELALAVSEGRLLLVAGLKSLNPSSAVLNALAGDRFAWSADGSTAAVYSSQAAQAQVIRDLRTAPAPGVPLDVPGTVSALAVSNAGDLIAALESGVALLASGSAPRLLAPIAAAGALAIGGRDLYAAGDNRIWVLSEFASSPTAAIFAEDAGAIVGLQVSGKRLYAADAASRTVKGFDLAARTLLTHVQLEGTPSELRAFGSPDIWLLNSDTYGRDPLYVATTAGDPAVYFVPSGRLQ
jgi:hypothetical protein